MALHTHSQNEQGRKVRPFAVIRSLDQVHAWCTKQRQANRAVHFVPTLGGLHAGHGVLFRQAASPMWGSRKPAVLVSVFVNPRQFGPGEDFHCYPRSPDADCSLAACAGADAVWLPSVGDVFGGSAMSAPDSLGAPMIPADLGGMCASGRPGHFEGVLAVMQHFLHILGPDRVLMGEKDFQQLQVIRRLVADVGIPACIISCATVRETDGLALSSRNERLTRTQRAIAPSLYSVLQESAIELATGKFLGEQVSLAKSRLLRAGFSSVEYIELRSSCSHKLENAPCGNTLPRSRARLFVAAWLGSVRLIDNVPVPRFCASSFAPGVRR